MQTDDTDTDRIPTVSMDYMFMNSGKEITEEGEDQHAEINVGMPILVMVDHATDMTFSSVVPRKGNDAFAIMRA